MYVMGLLVAVRRVAVDYGALAHGLVAQEDYSELCAVAIGVRGSYTHLFDCNNNGSLIGGSTGKQLGWEVD